MGDSIVSMMINGQKVLTGRPLRVFTGTPNTVAIRAEYPLDATIHVELGAPDGRSWSYGSSVQEGSGKLNIGPLCAPAVYEYERGVVYRRGYTLRVVVRASDGEEPLLTCDCAAVCSGDRDAEWLLPGAPSRCVYNQGYLAEGGSWNPFGESAGAMEPALQMKLAPEVLVDNNHVVVCFRTRPDPLVDSMAVQLIVTDEANHPVVDAVQLTADSTWRQLRLDVGRWPEGSFQIELKPVINDVVWPDGPRVRYRRNPVDDSLVRVSPYAPFNLSRDPDRDVVVISDWPDPLPLGWSVGTCGDGKALLCDGDVSGPIVSIDPRVRGRYAVFVEAVNAIHLRVGADDVVRRVHESECRAFGPVFAHVADMTDRSIDLYQDNLQQLLANAGDGAMATSTVLQLFMRDGTRSVPFDEARNNGEVRSGVRAIHLIPVTEASVQAFQTVTMQPPFELRGVDDWWCHFLLSHRVDGDQLDTIVLGQREVGITSVNWAVGRSCVQYPSRLPDAQVFPCTPIEDDEPIEKRHHWLAWQRILESCDTLERARAACESHGVRIQGWLAMNRHYGAPSLNGKLTSEWARTHPEFYQCRKDLESIDYTRMEFYFPEVRKERLDILEEVAGYGLDSVVLGCCRQPPMASYNAAMVAAYQAQTGVDPTTIDIEDGRPYVDWIQWRADFFTELLRELAQRLRWLADRTGQRVRVVARVPGIGLLWNLAEGMDIQTWVHEGLVDEIQLDPLECAAGHAIHDVSPYVDLCGAHGVRVLGGVNGATGANRSVGEADYSPVVGLRRAIGLLGAGVDGIEIYEAELFARCCERRWLIPLWGDPHRAQRWLDESNLEAVYPVTARNAALGHDNHWFGGETMHGAHGLPPGTKRPL